MKHLWVKWPERAVRLNCAEPVASGLRDSGGDVSEMGCSSSS